MNRKDVIESGRSTQLLTPSRTKKVPKASISIITFFSWAKVPCLLRQKTGETVGTSSVFRPSVCQSRTCSRSWVYSWLALRGPPHWFSKYVQLVWYAYLEPTPKTVWFRACWVCTSSFPHSLSLTQIHLCLRGSHKYYLSLGSFSVLSTETHLFSSASIPLDEQFPGHIEVCFWWWHCRHVTSSALGTAQPLKNWYYYYYCYS